MPLEQTEVVALVRILLVENNKQTASLVRDDLKESGHGVTVATNGDAMPPAARRVPARHSRATLDTPTNRHEPVRGSLSFLPRSDQP